MFYFILRFQVAESRVEDLVAAYFNELGGSNDQQLQLLTERGLAGAVTSFVDRDDKDALQIIMKSVLWEINSFKYPSCNLINKQF